MKVLVIGAAGRSGRAVVKAAVAAGHDVTAFVHNTGGYSPDSGVRVVQGDARDRSAMESAMHQQDAVIDTIGGKNPMKATILEASAAATITACMQSSGVRRLVVISMIGEGESKANTNWWQRPVLSTVLRAEMKDKEGMETVVDASGLDWTIVRPPFLNDHPGTGNIHVLSPQTQETGHKLTRADLADFLVAQLPPINICTRPWLLQTARQADKTTCKRAYAADVSRGKDASWSMGADASFTNRVRVPRPSRGGHSGRPLPSRADLMRAEPPSAHDRDWRVVTRVEEFHQWVSLCQNLWATFDSRTC